MKVYLSECSYGKDSYWSKNEAEKLKSKASKSNLKGKIQCMRNPQTNIRPTSGSNAQRAKSSRRQQSPHPISLKLSRPTHTRTHTDSDVQTKPQDSKSELNKTYSKGRLKTEVCNYNADTLKVIKKQIKQPQLEDNFVSGFVRDRLYQEKKMRKPLQTHSVKHIVQLANLVRKQTNNKIDSEKKRKQIESGLQIVGKELMKEQLTERQQALLQLIKALNNRNKQPETKSEGQKLLQVIRQLQSKNVRLMNLINFMKKGGVDVDCFWSKSNIC